MQLPPVYEHILVPLDGSPAAERVLEHAEAIALAFKSTLTLLRATVSTEVLLAQTANSGTSLGAATSVVDASPILDADRASALTYLNQVANRLRQHQVTVQVECPAGSASEEIVQLARTIGASLILMTTHGRSGLNRAVFGSVADSVLRHAPCPVFLLRTARGDDDLPAA